MRLSEYIEKNPSAFARGAGIPVPVITRFLNGERGLSAKTMAKIVRVTKGKVTYDDLISEMK